MVFAACQYRKVGCAPGDSEFCGNWSLCIARDFPVASLCPSRTAEKGTIICCIGFCWKVGIEYVDIPCRVYFAAFEFTGCQFRIYDGDGSLFPVRLAVSPTLVFILELLSRLARQSRRRSATVNLDRSRFFSGSSAY